MKIIKVVALCFFSCIGTHLLFSAEAWKPMEEPKSKKGAEKVLVEKTAELNKLKAEERYAREELNIAREAFEGAAEQEAQQKINNIKLKSMQIEYDLKTAEIAGEKFSKQLTENEYEKKDLQKAIDKAVREQDQLKTTLLSFAQDLKLNFEFPVELQAPVQQKPSGVQEKAIAQEQIKVVERAIENPAKMAEDLMSFNLPEEQQGPGVMQRMYDTSAQLLAQSAAAFKSSANVAIETTLQGLDKVQNIADRMTKIEENVSKTIKCVQQIDETTRNLAPVAQAFGQEASVNSVLHITGQILDRKEIPAIMSNQLAKAGRGLFNAVEMARNAINGVQEIVDPAVARDRARNEANQKMLKKVEDLINKERIWVSNNERVNKFNQVFVALHELTQKFSLWLRANIFNNSNAQQLTRAQQTYEQSRQAYLKALGFDSSIGEPITQDAIAQKLRSLNDQERRSMQRVAENFARSSEQLAKVYKNIADGLQNVAANYAFLINIWDVAADLPKQQKVEVAQLVEGIFDMRAYKLTMLDEMRKSIETLQNNIAQVTANNKDFAAINDTFIASLHSLIDNQTIKTIGEYDQIFKSVDQAVKHQREILESNKDVLLNVPE